MPGMQNLWRRALDSVATREHGRGARSGNRRSRCSPRVALRRAPAPDAGWTTCSMGVLPKVAKGRGEPKGQRPIRAFNKARAAARVAAGCPGRIPHDLRRTAVRNITRRGVSERVAMQLTGHKTRSVCDRYNFVSSLQADEPNEEARCVTLVLGFHRGKVGGAARI